MLEIFIVIWSVVGFFSVIDIIDSYEFYRLTPLSKLYKKIIVLLIGGPLLWIIALVISIFLILMFCCNSISKILKSFLNA